MKNLIKFIFCLAVFAFTENIYAQEKKPSKVEKKASEIGREIGETADTVADKTSEIAAKGVAEIADKTYKDKVGPNGQTIYIDSHSKYYYIDNEGHKVYVPKAKLKDKVAK